MHSKKDLTTALQLLVLAFAIFRLSPVRVITDSQFTMLYSQQLLWHHSLSLPAQAFPQMQSHQPGQIHRPHVDMPYQLTQQGEQFYFWYPIGNVILPIPYVLLANAVGLSAMDANGVYNVKGEARMQQGLASLLMAILTAITFLTNRLFLPVRWSVVLACATAFGTQIWSVASRAMWSHTWAVFLLSIAIWLIARAAVSEKPLAAVGLATCLAWMYFVRPICAVSVIAVSLYVLVYHADSAVRFAVTGVLWLGAFLVYSHLVFHQTVPVYFQQYGYRQGEALWQAIGCNLVSPGRGMFYYVPVALFVFYLLARYAALVRGQFVWLPLAAIFAHVVIVSGMVGCVGGHSYGPRYMTDVVPWFALLAIAGVEARLKWHQQYRAMDSAFRIRSESVVAILLLACSITFNGLGSIWLGGWRWNRWPKDIDLDGSRVWDWKHPQVIGVGRTPTPSPSPSPARGEATPAP